MSFIHWIAQKLRLQLIDPITFLCSFSVLIIATLPLLIWPEEGAVWINQLKFFVTQKMGVWYLMLGIGAVLFMTYITFSDIGQIKLGDAHETPQFSMASWAAMLFCGGIGASILYWGAIEWAYYYQSPPFNLQPESHEAVHWSSTYGIFHWGIIAWTIYLIPAVPIAYFYHVRKEPVLKISTALKPVIGEYHSQRWIGQLIDVFFIIGMLGGAATTLGFAAPLISEGLHELFNIPINTQTYIIVLLVATALFAYSSYAGIDKGIKVLSNINFWGAILLLLIIFLLGPSIFMLETGLTSMGRMLNNFFVMSTWMEPFRGTADFAQSNFPQDWTVFYWAWWLVFAPTIGLFIARISRGRTIRGMIIGSIFFGSFGCSLFFIVLGNYGLHLQLTGTLDVVDILTNQSPTAAIFAMLSQLPASKFIIALFTLLALIFTATSFDSISYILASAVQKNVVEEPLRWNRLFWAFALSLLPATLLLLGGDALSTLQTATVIGGLPLIVISILLMIATLRVTKIDLKAREEYVDPVICIDSLPTIDPWTAEGKAWSKFEALKDQAIQAASIERSTRDEIHTLRAQMNERVVQHGSLIGGMPSPTDAQLDELQILLNKLHKAIEEKSKLSMQAQQARIDYNQLIGEKNSQ